MQENARKILCDKTIGGKGELNPHTNLAFFHSFPSQLGICSSHGFHHKGRSHIATERRIKLISSVIVKNCH